MLFTNGLDLSPASRPDMNRYWETIQQVISRYPHFYQEIPPSWIKSITYDQVHNYEAHRTDKFWEHQNLPSLAFSLAGIDERETKELYQSILSLLEWFSSKMRRLPGGRSTLKPLWENAWTVDDCPFWSVISEVALARLLTRNNWTILGFNRPIAGENERSDIQAQKDNIVHHIDVEAASMTKEVEGEESDFRRFVEGRATKKIRKKFLKVPDGEVGVAAIIFRPQTANMARFNHSTMTTDIVESDRKNVYGKVYWLVGGKRDGENYGIHLIDNTIETSSF